MKMHPGLQAPPAMGPIGPVIPAQTIPRVKAISKKTELELRAMAQEHKFGLALDFLQGLIPLNVMYPAEEKISGGIAAAFARIFSLGEDLAKTIVKKLKAAFGLTKLSFTGDETSGRLELAVAA